MYSTKEEIWVKKALKYSRYNRSVIFIAGAIFYADSVYSRQRLCFQKLSETLKLNIFRKFLQFSFKEQSLNKVVRKNIFIFFDPPIWEN